MNRKALEEERRTTVKQLLTGMKIKSTAGGGLDQDSVNECLKNLCNLYEGHIQELEKNYEIEISQLEKKSQKFDETNEFYVSIMVEAQKSYDEKIKRAEAEVQEILEIGVAEKEKLRLEIEEIRLATEMEKETLKADLEALRDVVEKEKNLMRIDVEAEKEKLDALKNKYKQQVSLMDEEFEEIKTNIHLTAARLDSLKAQVDSADTASWAVQTGAIAVDLPEPEEGTENIMEIPDIMDTPEETEAEDLEPKQENDYLFKADDLFEKQFFTSEILAKGPVEEDMPQSADQIDIADMVEAAEPIEAVQEEAPVADSMDEIIGEAAVEEIALAENPPVIENATPVEADAADIEEFIAVQVSEPAEEAVEDNLLSDIEELMAEAESLPSFEEPTLNASEDFTLDAIPEPDLEPAVEPVVEPAAEEAFAPEIIEAIEEPAEALQVEPESHEQTEDVEVPVTDVEELLSEITFDDLLKDVENLENGEAKEEPATESFEEISLEDLISLDDGGADALTSTARYIFDNKEAEAVAVKEAEVSEAPIEEISFEGLETFFEEK